MGRIASDATHTMSRRAEALLRALVGVHEAEVSFRAGGGIAQVRVAAAGISSGLVIRNIRSALMAGLGVRVEADQIELIDPAAWIAIADAAATAELAQSELTNLAGDVADASPGVTSGTASDTAPIADPAVSARPGNGAKHNGNGTGNGHAHTSAPGNGAVKANGKAHGNGHGVAGELPPPEPTISHEPLLARPENRRSVSVERPVRSALAESDAARAPKVERVDIVRHGGRLRCRVVIAVDSERFTAIADAADEPGSEIQLAGRVTCDALRAGNLTNAQFECANVAYLAGRVHVVAALGDWHEGEPCPRSGSAVAHESLEHATARAVLQAALTAI